MFEQPQRLVHDAWVLLRNGASLRQFTGHLEGGGPSLALTYLGPAAHEEQCTVFFDGKIDRRPGALLRPDVLVVAEPLRLPLRDVLRYSPFLDAVLDVRPDVEAQIRAVRSKAHRRRLRAASRGAWGWSASSTPAALEHFYRTFHRPYVAARFGEAQLVVSLEHLQARLSGGGQVVTVTHHGEPVGGALLFDTPEGLDYDRNGFRVDEHPSAVVLSQRTAALELAIFELAQQRAARTIFLGFCRAHVDDGLFTHKRRLGCRFQPARGTGRSQLWVRPALRPRFFSARPLVMGPVDAFEVHVGLCASAPRRSRTEWRARLKNFAMPAVRRVVVWTDVPTDDPRRQQLVASLRTTLVDREVVVRQSRPAD